MSQPIPRAGFGRAFHQVARLSNGAVAGYRGTVGETSAALTSNDPDMPAGTKMVVYDRPTEPGVYFQVIQLPKRVSLLDAQKLEGKITLPSEPGMFMAGMILDYNAGGLGSPGKPLDSGEVDNLLKQIKANQLTPEILSNIRLEPKLTLLGDPATQMVQAVGFFFIVQKKLPTPTGYAPKKTYIGPDGKVILEEDIHNNTYLGESVNTVGIAPLALAPIAWAALGGLFATVIAGVALLIAGGVLYAAYKVVQRGNYWVDALLDKIGLPRNAPKASDVAKRGSVWKPLLIGTGLLAGGYLLYRLARPRRRRR